MAKTTGPLFSLDAHKSLGKELTYSRRRSGSQCRQYNKPTGIPSAKQRGQRRLTEFLVAQWQNMSAADKATWAANARGTGLNLSGYHYFLQSAQKDLYTHHGLCGYWHCNEVVNNQVLDLSGNRNHGSLQPTFPSNAPRLVNSYNTRFNKGLLYDGIDERVRCGTGASLNLADVGTVALWANISSYPDTYPTFVGKGASAGWDTSGYAIWYNKPHGIYGTISNRVDGPNYNQVTFGKPAVNTWHDFILVWDGDNVFAYLDAKQTATVSQTLNVPITADDLWFGFPYYFHGISDEICLYKRALSAGEILTRYRFALQKVG